MTIRDRLFLESKAWAQEKLSLDNEYFHRLANMHNPEILWIGSSDSLLPILDVTNTDPGEILVYRNIGSQVREDDLGLMTLIEDFVEGEQMKYIILCGYSHCSGIRDVLLGKQKPHVRSWLKSVFHLYEENRGQFEGLDFAAREKKLSEMNVRLQLEHLSQLECIQRAWDKGDRPKLFGWYFDLNTGSFHEVSSMENNHRPVASTPLEGRVKS